MSDLRPNGVKVELGGQERTLLFTINTIDEIQEKCNMPLYDAVSYVAKAADGKMDHETLTIFRSVVTALLNSESGEKLEEKEVGRLLTLHNYCKTALAVLRAYGLSIPDPDEEDGDDEEEESPNVETGQ